MPGTSTLIASSARGPKRRFISATDVCSCIHTPDRSGLPSAVRGVGAARLGLPSDVRGVPGGTKFNHCASALVPRNANSTINEQCRIIEDPPRPQILPQRDTANDRTFEALSAYFNNGGTAHGEQAPFNDRVPQKTAY